MAVKLVVFNDDDPGIAITFSYSGGTSESVEGWRGSCTECGKILHLWTEERAVRQGQEHVDTHGTGERS